MIGITGASRLSAILTLDITQFMRNSEIARTEIARFQQQAQRFGAGLTRTLSLGLGLIGAASLGIASNFSEISTQLRAIGQEGIEGLISTARDLGRETKFTSTETATLALELTKLGFNAQEASGALTTSVKLSQIFGGSLDKVGTSIAETQRQFREFTGETRSFEEIGDIFAVAFQNSALDVDNLAGALKNVGSVAKISGYDLERTVATLGALANAGQKAERGGTRLKTTIIRLGKELGFGEDQIRLLESGTLDTAQIFDLLKNRAGLAGAVIAQLPTEIKLLEQKLKDSKGALDALNAGLGEQLFLSTARAKAGVEDLSISLGEGLAPFVAIAADLLQLAAKRFDTVSENTKEGIGLFITMGTVIPVLIVVISQLGGALLALGLSTVAATAGLTALVGVIAFNALQQKQYLQNQEKINGALETFSDLATEVGGNISNSSLPALQALKKQTEEALEAVTDAREDLGSQQLGELAGGGFGAGFGVGVILRSLGIVRSNEEGINGVRRDRNVLLANEYRLQKQLEVVTAAIQEKQQKLKDLADEQLVLAQQYGAEFGNSVTNIDALQKGWAKTQDNIAKALAEFGLAKNDIYDVSDEIARIKDFGLLRILETGGIPEAENFLGDLIAGGGTLEQQKKLVDSIIAELSKTAVAAATSGAVEVADLIDKGVTSYERLQRKLEQDIKVAGIRSARVEAQLLNEATRELGQSTELQFLQAELSALQAQFTGLAQAGVRGGSLSFVADQIDEIKERIERAQFRQAFEEFTDSATNASATALQFKRILGAATELDVLQAAAQRASEKVNILSQGFLLGEISEGEFRRSILALNEAINQVDIQKLEDAVDDANEALGQLSIAESLGRDVDLSTQTNKQVEDLTKLVEAYRKLRDQRKLTAAESAGLLQAEEQLGISLQAQEDIANAATLTSFLGSQVQFLGDAFLQAARDGADFFTVLKKSFLDTFYALVAKLITLIALYTILAIVSGGATAGSGGFAGAAAAATQGGLGSFIGSGLTGLKSNTVSGPAQGEGGTQPTIKVEGGIVGTDLVLINQRGKRALDRTFG